MTVTAFPERVETVRDYPLTDAGNRDWFAHEVDGRVAFDHTAQQWRIFDGHHWHLDHVGTVQELAIEAVRARQHEAALLADKDARKAAFRWALKSEDRRQIANLLALAQSHPGIGVEGSQWNPDPMVFGVSNGLVDLDRGVLRGGCKHDRVTKFSPVAFDAEARAPRFERFLDELFRSTPDVIPWLHRVIGYCLTGLTSEQQFWIWWGSGSNGKSTFLKLLLDLFGMSEAGYGWTMPFPTSHWSSAVTEYQRAELPGRRLVAASEVKRRAPLHEDFLKSLTGGDRVNARQPYGRPFTFAPICKFILLCNERPVIRDLTTSMWRRVRLVPFIETFAVDDTLGPTLAAESAGILNWAIQGCLEWQRDGLRLPPAAVEAATAQYREESDPLAEFYAERCTILDGLSVGGAELFAAYRTWCQARQLPDEDRLTQKSFGLRVKERFPDKSRSDRKVIYSGISLVYDGERSWEP